MGFFDFLFGTGEYSAKNKFSDHAQMISPEVIKRLISQGHVKSLSRQEETLVEDMIIKGRYDGRISLRGINMILRSLEKSHKISMYDRRDVMKVFQQYFDQGLKK